MKPTARSFARPDAVLPGAQFADSYALIVEGRSLDAIAATQLVMQSKSSWISGLMKLRNIAVRPLGLKAAPDENLPPERHIGTFPVISRSPTQVVLGLDDRHLDFRVIVDVRELGGGRQEVSASTVVKTHNLLGRTYLAIVKPFHRVIVPAMLARLSPA